MADDATDGRPPTTMTPGVFFFYLLAAVIVVSAAGVALARNILYSAFALLGTLAGVAGLYLYMGADFLGVAQLIIYIGGILVLHPVRGAAHQSHRRGAHLQRVGRPSRRRAAGDRAHRAVRARRRAHAVADDRGGAGAD